MLDGIVLIGFVGFVVGYVVNVIAKFQFIESLPRKSDILLALQLVVGELLAFGWGLTKTPIGGLFSVMEIEMNVYLDIVITGVMISVGGTVAQDIMGWLQANREIAQKTARKIE